MGKNNNKYKKQDTLHAIGRSSGNGGFRYINPETAKHTCVQYTRAYGMDGRETKLFVWIECTYGRASSRRIPGWRSNETATKKPTVFRAVGVGRREGNGEITII